MDADHPFLLNGVELAALLGVSKSKLYLMHRSGELGPPQVDKLVSVKRWSRFEVQAWVAAGCPPRREWLALRGQLLGTAG